MPVKDATTVKEFVDGWIHAVRRKLHEPKLAVWREIVANVLVTPYQDEENSTDNPYGKGRSGNDTRGMVLKDPESSQIAETFRDNMMGALFSDPEDKFVQATPVGFEDIVKADTVSRLLRYNFRLPGVYRTLSESMLDLAMFGTVVLETPWCTEYRDVVVREMEEYNGQTIDRFYREKIKVKDDPDVRQIDLLDWYPDPEEPRLEKGRGAAKGFEMTPSTARYYADEGTYDKAAVEQAIKAAATRKYTREKKADLRHEDQEAATFSDDFDFMEGYEYWGEVPWESSDGVQRRVLTMLNGVIVRNDPWPLTDPDLPFHVLVINPVKGRHYGKAPAEIVRFTQDFADAMLMLIAEATVRQVHPSIAIDITKDIDPAQVRAWSPDAVIAVEGSTAGAIDTIQYGSNIFAGTQFQQQLKTQMQQSSGALGPVQGHGLGVNRASATEAQATFQKAMTKIEAVAQLLEKDGLPSLARGLLRRNQQFLEDTEELKLRVGDAPESVWLGDILGDFDIAFVGTRNAISRQVKLQAIDRLIQMAQAMPQLVAARIPWDKVLERMFGDVLQAPEIAAYFGEAGMAEQQQAMLQNLLLQAAQQGMQGQAPAAQPESVGTSEAEATGGVMDYGLGLGG